MNDNQADVDRLASARLIELAISGIGPGFYKEIAFKSHQWQQIIAALRRRPERPPSGEMVMVPREPTRAMLDAFNKWAQCEGYIEEGYRAMLSAAEAEGRKS